MDSSFFLSFPRCVRFRTAGSGRGEEPSGAKVLRLIQIRLATSSLEKIFRLGKTNCLPANDANRRERDRQPVWLKSYRLFNAICGAGLITSSWAFTFCRPRASTSICFCWRAIVTCCSSFLRCSFKNSLSNIAFTCSYRTL
jgi:hypothetical protein